MNQKQLREKMKHFNLHSILNSAILVGLLAAVAVFYFKDQNKTMVYIDNIQLFNEFNMTKEIKGIEEKKINERSKQLDSVYKILQEEKDQNSNRAKQLVREVKDRSVELQEIKSNYQNNMSQNVWNRLNAYITEYSEEHQLSIVFGTNGNGNVMYAEEDVNITDEVLEFSNSKYEGN